MKFRAVRMHPSHSTFSHSATPGAVTLGSAAGMAHTVDDRQAMVPGLKAEIAVCNWLIFLQEPADAARRIKMEGDWR